MDRRNEPRRQPIPVILNEVMATKFRVVTGYLGTKETFMAIENGEAHGRCGLTYSSLKASKPDWLRDKTINLLMQMGLEKSPELPNVPLAADLIANPEDRQLLDLLITGTSVGRPFALPPGTPPARVIQAEISPTSGEDVQKIITRLYATPKAVVERARRLLEPQTK